MLSNALQPARPRELNGRDLMISSLRIENFRCYEDLRLDDLGTVNVIVGDNASGKTALLEAIFLASTGNPEVNWRLKSWRGISTVTVQRTRKSFEALWAELFFDSKKDIKITLIGSPENQRTLNVGWDRGKSGTVAVETMERSAATSSDSTTVIPIVFDTEKADGVHEIVKMTFAGEGVVTKGVVHTAPIAFFASGFWVLVPPSESADQFSELSKKGEDTLVRKTIAKLFPGIGQLSLETYAGAGALYCIPPGSKGKEKLPVAIVSTALTKLLAILLGMATSAKNGVVLIDEIENGIYHGRLGKVWECIYAFAKAFDVQVFAATHSMECLRAALPTLKDHEQEFRLLRAERHEDKRIVRVFEGSKFESALESDYEIR
jgi:predicted ATPase